MAVRDVAAAPGRWRPGAATRIVLVPGSSGRLRDEARTTAAELVQEGHLDRSPQIVVKPHPAPHDLALQLGRVPGSASPEAYRVETAGDVTTITGSSATGSSTAPGPCSKSSAKRAR
ncbi:hypothetical protein [Streptomyces sp. NBC_01320]|uniref:hypothetical protein n=1 Tax=Streptomyces sp. NBC_01320 TaxID=2903824 RepID=UPI002E1165E1|nr:glycoside hydrolase family 20 zincin-like fold domain-containing protein [Streptomyces sp. NBC_01320]